MSGLPDPRIPAGPIADAWRRTREGLPLISPLRKGQMDVLVVGTGLAGAHHQHIHLAFAQLSLIHI